MNLKQIIEDNSSGAGRVFDLVSQALIVASLVSFTVETLPDLEPGTRELLSWFEAFTVAIFTLEYLLRLAVADNKMRYVFSFYGLLDLAAILPFYLVRGVDLRGLRVFRLLRLVRAFKLMRYSRAIQRFAAAFKLIQAELVLFGSVTCFMLFVSAVGIYYCEHTAQPEVFKSVPHSLWWAVTTLTTVGYGDAYPVTVGGKVFTFFILMVGLGVVSVPAGLLASALTKTGEVEKDRET